MHFEVVYTSGLSGFIGRNLIQHLLEKFPLLINFRRGNFHEIYSRNGCVKVENRYFNKSDGSKLFLSIAALYKAFPSSRKELAELYDSNAVLPIKLIEEYIGSENLKVIQISSYFQLLDLEFQTPYSLTKSLANAYLKQNYDSVSVLYLFDTFGDQDDRSRVIDTFITKIKNSEPIALPKEDVYINVSHVSDVCRAIISSIDLPSMDYCVMSGNTLSLRFIAEEIMRLIGNRVKVNELTANIDYFYHLNKANIPKNLFPTSGSRTFEEYLEMRINEIG